MSWRDNAACKSHPEIDWFPQSGTPDAEARANLARARAVCAGCPVKDECYGEAILEPWTAGIWAGTTNSQRRRAPQQPRRRAPVARCGTDAGYSRHRRMNENPCQECKEAHAMAFRLRKHTMAIVR